MTAQTKTIRIPANLPAVATACNFVVKVAIAAGMDEKQVHQCQLAVDEACTNIIEHGYQAHNQGQFIDVTCLLLADRITIRIEDDSPAYNPLQRSEPEPDADAALEDRERGGWGVFFIKQVMDDVVYHYRDGRNQLDMTRYFRSETTPYSTRLDQVDSISIEANGDVSICFFRIGNVYEEDILAILERYNPYEIPMMKVLLEEGISGLIAYAGAQGLELDISKFHTPCGVCRYIVDNLHSK